MGIPPGYGVRELLFSAAANALVVQTQAAKNIWRPERLYFRPIGSENYNLIGQPSDLVSQEYPFVHPSKPLLACNCMKHRFYEDVEGKEFDGADWDSIHVYKLESGLEVKHIKEGALTLPSGIVSGWVSKLVGYSDAGLFVQAGSPKAVAEWIT